MTAKEILLTELIKTLRVARYLAKQGGALRTKRRVDLAITSAQGAIRNAQAGAARARKGRV